MKIKWIGHACFKITEDNYSIVINPFTLKMLPRIGDYKESAHQVLCTHEHDDHNFREAITILDQPLKNPFKISYFTTYHDEELGKKRGKVIVYILKTKDYKLAHLGDLGCNLDNKQIDLLKNTDFLMIPIGGYYTIDSLRAIELISQIEPKTVIPMHYQGDDFGFKVLSKLEEFTNNFDEKMIKYLDNNEIDLETEDTNKVLVFKLK